VDGHRLIIEINDGSGTWQLPIEKEQAKQLSVQLQEMTTESSNGAADLQKFLDHSMVKMPKGILWMGAMPEAKLTSDAMPRHRVDIAGFEMSAVLVTQGLWRHVMGSNPSSSVGSKKPVHQISWWDAIRFCNAMSEKLGLELAYQIEKGSVQWNQSANGFRLPTEAEWEYAARTRDDLRFSGGDDISTLGWTVENQLDEMPDVGLKDPNLWGFHDLSGLVFEWCWDDHAPYNLETSTDSTDNTSQEPPKVCRGGSWKHEAQWAMCSARFSYPSEYQGWVGLRLTRNPTKT
jgi:formylglycine-generating enzyme required for sulfatase activity